MYKKLLRHSIIYGIADLLKNATGFVLLPIYTVYLTPAEYGILEIFVVSNTLIVGILQLGLRSAIFKYYSYENSSTSCNNPNRVIISSSFYFLMFFSAIVVSVSYFFSDNISLLLFKTSNQSNLVVLLLVTVFLQMTFIIPIAFLRIQNKSVLLSMLNGAQFLFQIALTIFVVIVLRKKIDGVLEVRAITAGIFAIQFVWVIRKQLGFYFSSSVLKELLSYGIYLVPVAICTLIIMLSNRYFILSLHNSEELGFFSVANRISTVLLLAVYGFQMAWPSIMFSVKEKTNAKEFYSRIFTYYVIIFSFLTLILTLFAGELVLLLSNQNYYSAKVLIPVLSLSYFFYGTFFVGTVGLNIFKKTYYQSIAMIVGASVNILLTYFLTQEYGIVGSSVGLCISFAIVSLLAFYFSQRIYYIQIEWNRITKYILFLSVVPFIYFVFLTDITILNIILKICILFIFLPIIFFFGGIFTPDEKKIVFSIMTNYKQKLIKKTDIV